MLVGGQRLGLHSNSCSLLQPVLFDFRNITSENFLRVFLLGELESWGWAHEFRSHPHPRMHSRMTHTDTKPCAHLKYISTRAFAREMPHVQSVTTSFICWHTSNPTIDLPFLIRITVHNFYWTSSILIFLMVLIPKFQKLFMNLIDNILDEYHRGF